jgi:hypothetical protein
MKIDKLEELQAQVNALQPLSVEECAALIGEVWRFKTAQTARDLELGYLKDGHEQLKQELDGMIEANRLLHAENDLLKSIHGLPHCDLENRWSNCAVRMRKQRELEAGKHVNGKPT